MGPGRGQRWFWPSDPHEKKKSLQSHLSVGCPSELTSSGVSHQPQWSAGLQAAVPATSLFSLDAGGVLVP